MSTERDLPEVGEEIHLPGGSAQPLMLAVGITFILLGVTVTYVFLAFGLLIFFVTLYLWIRDAIQEYKDTPESHDH